jgi:preprotein translocase subunit SecF
MNKDYPLYYKLDFSFVIINGILILINIIFLCCNKNVEGFEINEEEEIESESDEEQIKINDLEIQNANLEKERETIRNEIDNNKKLIIQQQNDLEEKTKWEERQKKENEKIQLDLNNQVRNLRLSLESKNRELERKDFDLQSQHEKTLELKNQLRDTISEYNALIKGLESDKNKLQDEK